MEILDAIACAAGRRGRAGGSRRWVALLGLALVCFGPAAESLFGAAAPSREYQIKAVFLYNFVQFVEWPDAAFSDAGAPLRIGVLGEDPFGPALDEAVQGETIRSRRLVVKRAQRLDELADCQLVFFAKSEAWQVSARRDDQADARPVLTVGETEDFARRGGVIAFYSEGKKVRFEINADLARRLGLKISSELLKLGKVVGAEAPAGGA